MEGDVGITELKNIRKQGRDDNIKQFTIQPHNTYLFPLKVCRVELYTSTKLYYQP